MERNKYREQIQNSVCTPSEVSWEKLDKKLTDHDSRKINNKGLFMKYAVSVLLIVFASSYFFQAENEIARDKIKVSPEVEKSSVKPPATNSKPDTYSTSPTENSSRIKMMETNSPANKTINYEVKERLAIKNEDSMEKDKNSQRVMPKYYATNPSNENSKITQQNVNTEDEVDALLKNAMLNIEKNDLYLNKSKISALDLLGEIEDDLEKDSRRKLFEKIIITIKNPTEIAITDRSK